MTAAASASRTESSGLHHPGGMWGPQAEWLPTVCPALCPGPQLLCLPFSFILSPLHSSWGTVCPCSEVFG